MSKLSYLTGLGRLPTICLILLLLLPFSLAACQGDDVAEARPADYGLAGSRLALSLARQYPNRSAGSTQERQAGDLIIRVLEEAGYDPVVTTFFFADEEGNARTSRNISVTIPGQGFIRTDDEGNSETFRRQVVVGAHYDTYFSAEAVEAYRVNVTPTPVPTPEPEPDETDPEATPIPTAAATVNEPTLLEFDGIHDNASGIGALITLAWEIRNQKLGYDVILVAFGAGEAGQAGARAFVDRMTPAEIRSTDVMYCIDAIYAGDKIYAHAGRNSLRSHNRKAYEMRRKLYEVTDVFYEYELYTNNGYMLYTNQCNFNVPFEGMVTEVLYREWTLTDSDYLPFDEKGIPIVFFESFDYDGSSLENLRESKNPAFSSTGGAIRHTRFDSTAYLNMILNQRRSTIRITEDASEEQDVDRLTRRINNTAFVILEAIHKGVHDAEMFPDQTEETADPASVSPVPSRTA